MKSPLQKISAKQASLERRWGYFKREYRDDAALLARRIEVMESFFKISVGEDGGTAVSSTASAEGGHVPPIQRSVPLDCNHCSLLVEKGLPPALIVELHAAAHPSARQFSVYERDGPL